MKKQILSAAVLAASLVSFSSALAADSLTLYGQANVGLSFKKTGADNTSNYSSPFGTKNSSRWGIKGAEDLGGGMGGIFVIESGIFNAAANSYGDTVAVGSRLFYVGVNTPTAGEFSIGKNDTASSWMGNFSDSSGPAEFITGVTTDQSGTGSSLFWRSPSWNGLKVAANLALGNTYKGEADTKKDPQYGLAVRFDGGSYGAGVSYDSDANDSAKVDTLGKKTQLIVGGFYKIANFRIGADYGKITSDADNNGKKDGYRYAQISFGADLGASAVNVYVGQLDGFKTDDVKADPKKKATEFGAEYVYKMSPRTRLGIAFESVKDKNGGGTKDKNGGGTDLNALGGKPTPNKTATGLGFGIKHKF